MVKIRYHIDKLELHVDDEMGLCQNIVSFWVYPLIFEWNS